MTSVCWKRATGKDRKESVTDLSYKSFRIDLMKSIHLLDPHKEALSNLNACRHMLFRKKDKDMEIFVTIPLTHASYIHIIHIQIYTYRPVLI